MWRSTGPGAHWICREKFCCQHSKAASPSAFVKQIMKTWSLTWCLCTLSVFWSSPCQKVLLLSCPLPESPVHPPSPPALPAHFTCQWSHQTLLHPPAPVNNSPISSLLFTHATFSFTSFSSHVLFYLCSHTSSLFTIFPVLRTHLDYWSFPGCSLPEMHIYALVMFQYISVDKTWVWSTCWWDGTPSLLHRSWSLAPCLLEGSAAWRSSVCPKGR